MEANSYKRSVHEESRKNDELIHLSNKLKQEQYNSQHSLQTHLDKFNNSRDEYAKSIQIAEFQQKNLDQILFVRNSIIIFTAYMKKKTITIIAGTKNYTKRVNQIIKSA